MPLTRRTARFGQLAAAVEAELTRRGIQVDDERIDLVLNARVERSAQLLGVTPRAALRYAPDDVALWVADELTGSQAAPSVEAASASVVDLDSWRKGRDR